MKRTKTTTWSAKVRLLPIVTLAASLLVGVAHAAAPGIRSTSFELRAEESYISQPDGNTVYSWGYGCERGSAFTFEPAMPNNACPTMQVPGPTLVVTQGQQFTVTLTNALPTGAGNTSILFPGLTLVSATGGAAGLLTQEATPGGGGDVHAASRHSGHALVLQRHAGRPADRDGSLWCDHRRAANAGRPRTAQQASQRRTPRLRLRTTKRSSGTPLLPTTTPRPATTANTCSSFPRSTSASIGRRWNSCRQSLRATRRPGLPVRRR